MTATPYSVVSSGGVTNKRTRQSADDATLEDLYSAHSKPKQIGVSAEDYHGSSKRDRNAIKMELPYFVGAVLSPPTRHDDNVQERTLLALDVEQGKGQDTVPPDPRDVAQALKELGGEGWVYTSLSHTSDAPRYRVVLPLGKPIRGETAEEMQALLHATTIQAAKKLGIEEWTRPESWVLSQAMFLPAQLQDGEFYQKFVRGKPWRTAKVATKDKDKDAPADIPDEVPDAILTAIKRAGLYITENSRHPGMHFIRCPFIDQHGMENDTQTVYYEAHYDGNPRAAVKCFDTEPDEDGKPHLTYSILVRWLKDNGHLSDVEQLKAGVYEDFDAFDESTGVGSLLSEDVPPRQWAIDDFAPRGKVTVISGPGGQGKSILTLHIAAHLACGIAFGPFKSLKPVRTLYVSYEDGKPELQPRIKDLKDQLREHEELEGVANVDRLLHDNLRVHSVDEDDTGSWVLANKPERFGELEATPRMEWLREYLVHAKIDLLVLDPFVYVHEGDENANREMAVLQRMLGATARHANCAILLIHHMSKTGAFTSIADMNATNTRGASSITDNARSVGMVVSMPSKDAVEYGLDEDTANKEFVVFKHVKTNYSAPLPLVVMERRGRLLAPRTEIQRMSKAQISVAEQERKDQQNDAKLGAYAPKILQALIDHSAPMSQAQIGHELSITGARAKPAIQWCVDRDLIELEESEHHGRTFLHRITKEGKAYLKAYNKGSVQ